MASVNIKTLATKLNSTCRRALEGAAGLPFGAEGGARLGWDTWLRSGPFDHHADDAVFPGEEVRFVEPTPAAGPPNSIAKGTCLAER